MGGPVGGTPSRRMEKGESGGHATGPGKVNQQRAKGEVLGGVPRAHPMPGRKNISERQQGSINLDDHIAYLQEAREGTSPCTPHKKRNVQAAVDCAVGKNMA